MKATITNSGKAAQGVHTDRGLKLVPAGGSRTVDATEATLVRLERLAHISIDLIDDDEAAEPVEGFVPPANGEIVPLGHMPFADKTDDELRDMIEAATGKRPHPNAKRETLIERAAEALDA